MKKIISIVCLLAMLLSMLPVAAPQAEAATLSASADSTYQVGYARVDINPYVEDGTFDSGIMALPLRGFGDVWNRLSTGLLDDNGDGTVDANDGLKATCIAVTDAVGTTVLMFTVDLIGGTMGDDVRPAVVERVNAALETGELTGLLPITEEQIYYTGTHTHSAPDTTAYKAAGKTGTNDAGVDLSVVNENLGIWMERTIEDLGDAAVAALADRAAATLSKDRINVNDATSDVVAGKVLDATRHYVSDVDGETVVSGDNFNSIDKYDYADTSDYETSRGIDPQQVTQADENMYLLRFSFEDQAKLPVIMTGWRGHPSLNTSNSYENSSRYAISSDYVNAFRHAVEYGCEVEINGANGYVTDWTLGTQQQYRVAFFQGTGGNVNPRGFERVTYSGTEGDVQQYAYQIPTDEDLAASFSTLPVV